MYLLAVNPNCSYRYLRICRGVVPLLAPWGIGDQKHWKTELTPCIPCGLLFGIRCTNHLVLVRIDICELEMQHNTLHIIGAMNCYAFLYIQTTMNPAPVE